MKFIGFSIIPAEKAAAIAQAVDKVQASTPQYKRLAAYTCLAHPVSGLPPGAIVVVSIVEADSAEVLAPFVYAFGLGSASINYVPAQELPAGPKVSETEKKFRPKA